MSNYERKNKTQISLNLDKDKDKEVLAFIEGKNKSAKLRYILKTAVANEEVIESCKEIFEAFEGM